MAGSDEDVQSPGEFVPLHLLVSVLFFHYFSVSSGSRQCETVETSEHCIPRKNETNKACVFKKRVITVKENKTACSSFEAEEPILQH